MDPFIPFRRFRLIRRGNIDLKHSRFSRIVSWITPVWLLILELSGCSTYPSPSSGPPPALSIAAVQDLGVIRQTRIFWEETAATAPCSRATRYGFMVTHFFPNRTRWIAR
jgi:hypothetical protein